MPNEVITDQSPALIGAVVKAFTSFKSTKDYLNHSFLVLEKKKTYIPSCFIRLDTSHFVKIFYGMTCFKFIDKRVKLYYVKHLHKLKSCTEYEVAKLLIENLVTVAMQKFDRYDENGQKTRCEVARERLKQLNTENETKDESLDAPNKSQGNDIWDDSIEEPLENDFLSWFDSIVLKEKIYADLSDTSDYFNVFFLPSFIRCFRRLLEKLPLWSNVMIYYYKKQCDVPSSSNVESYFKNVKHLLLGTTNKLIRVDDFIIRHVEYLSGEVKAALCNFNSDKEEKPLCYQQDQDDKKDINKSEFPPNSIFSPIPSLNENWRNKCEETKSKAKTLSESVKPRSQKNNIDFLINGNKCGSGVKNVILNNTCAFDSVLQAFVVAYVGRSSVTKLIDGLNTEFSALVEAIAKKGYFKNVYTLRTDVLLKHCTIKKQNDLLIIDCTSTIAFVLRTVLSGQIFSSTFR